MEVEFSLFTTDILHNGIASTCADLGIPIVAYSPLGWGVLAGAFTSRSEIPEGDYRLRLQKFQEGNFNTNMKLVEEVRKLAERKKAAPAQIALGWILGMSEREGMPTIIPIPGGTTLEKVRENLTAEKLDEEEMREIDAILGRNRIEGGRGMSAH